ncbi:MAG: hypothetical protein HS122_04385 [Opitutaceae bacterium]|nr:hypothetical protein [Opitutaceae bacterium]
MSRPGSLLGKLGRSWRNGPLLISVLVHALILGTAGVYVVRETRVGGRRGFEATPRNAPEAAVREVEHRIQVARRGAGSASASPVSTQRILSSAAAALAMPALPELGLSGASLFGGGLGGLGSGAGMAAGSGLATGLGREGLGGRGFVSLSFLGMVSQRMSRVAFVVDVSKDLMDIRKGGFKAFGIIREEMMRLVSQLPPGAEFGVVLYGGAAGDLNLFQARLVPATVANKEAFLSWMKPVNSDPARLGTHSAGAHRAWKQRSTAQSEIDATVMVPNWVRGVNAALEMAPETVFLIAGSAATGLKARSDERMAVLEQRNDRRKDQLRRAGIDPEQIAAARNRALARARQQLAEINATLKAQGRSPYIVTDTKRVFQPDFQAELKRAGFTIELDVEGWADAQGKPIWELGVSQYEKVEFTAILGHVARLQATLLRERAALNAFLFTGPGEKPVGPIENLTVLTRRNGGKFELLSAKGLEEFASKSTAKARAASGR